MNILLTGGTGFIGSHLLKRLTLLNHKLIVIKRATSDTWRLKDISHKLIFFNVDSPNDLTSLFKKYKPDLIIHLAMVYKKNTDNILDLENMNYVNISFPSLLLQLAILYRVKAFINTGTCFEYKLPDKHITEKSLTEPYNYYAATKLSFEEILKYFTSKHLINAMTLRLFYPYGEMSNKKIIPLMINALLKNKELEVSLGKQKYNYTYVNDIIDAYINCIDYILSKKYRQYEIINIGESEVYSLREIGKKLEIISGRKKLIKFVKPYLPDEIMYCSCDNTKARQLLNWLPKTNILKGLENVYKSQKLDCLNFELGKSE